MNSSTFRVDFEPIGKRVDIPPGSTLLDASRLAGVGLASVCGGEGTCGRCRVVVMSGVVSPPVDADRRFLSQIELNSGQRLACRCQIQSDVKVHVPKASLVTDQRLQLEGIDRRIQVQAAVRAYEIEVATPTLNDLRSDVARVSDVLETAFGLRRLNAGPAVVRMLSPLARRTEWRLTVYVRGREIVGVAARGRKPVGVAVDLGTTKIAGYLVDLETGVELASAGAMNPQIRYGEDVISRLAYANRNINGRCELARAVREEINSMAGALAEQAGVARDQIAEVCIVGNTAMTHLLLDLPVNQLATAPFVSASSAAMDVKAYDLGFDFAPGAYVHILPCVAGFVGADHVAMIIGSDLDRRTHGVIGVDIGTNTEIALFTPGLKHLMTASCASGPAFEGAHIRDGMRAATGAIEAVRITSDGVEIKTIGDAAPVGLCGSGIVDAIAALRCQGIIDFRGRIQGDAPGVQRNELGYKFVIVPAERSGTGRDIAITQRDVSEIQLAKGAIAAGVETLMEAAHIDPAEIEEVIVAGAFGSYLNLESALAIGLLPRLNARYVQVGNAAGVGAKAALLSLEERRRARDLAQRTGYAELTTYRSFSSRYARAMMFPQDGDQARCCSRHQAQ